jgi:hypothetical protein
MITEGEKEMALGCMLMALCGFIGIVIGYCVGKGIF